MGQPQIELLAEIVARYDEREQPVEPADFASTQGELRSVRSCFEDFESKYLLKAVGDGYRPTVTARELLELDVDDETVLFLDCDPEE